ncbi:MAG: polysaccharide biosynthesis protein [Deltaproteobacteria bacterium]|nr:polysaccharide biosynthesis protein [Deltaproteobacteria bacterium]
MPCQYKKLNFWVIIVLDALLLSAAHIMAYWVRFDGHIASEWHNIRRVLPLYLPFKLIVFYLLGLYRGMWRYTGISDLLNIIKAVAVTTISAICFLVVLNRFAGFSRSVFLMDGLFSMFFIGGLRLALRIYYQRANGTIFTLGRAKSQRLRKNLLIIGAGDAAEKIAREIIDNHNLPYRAVGFLDDNLGKIGNYIHGIPVLGSVSELHETIIKTHAKEILIAIPSANRAQMNRIVELCRVSGLPYKTMPGLGEMIDNNTSIRRIREVSYRDLLGRPPVHLGQKQITEIIRGRCVMITGAGGSIGSELCRQLLRFAPARLILFDAGEQNLYQIEMELLYEHNFKNYTAVLGKVQDRELLRDIFSRYHPQVVFHAAAYKHVPMIEKNPWEGVYNNIFASRRLMRIAGEFAVERFIVVSTDKAVRPTNVMGATKRMTEIIMQAYAAAATPAGRGKTRFMGVRFGNVIGSSGSVLPLFKRQIELGGPVTVTHPDINRYFMSIDEAAQLILQAAAMGKGGEIFLLKMGTPVRIAQMARDLIRLCGREPDTEIAIKYTGLRPGEKLHEELITEGEGIVRTAHEQIMTLRGNSIVLDDLVVPLERLKQCANRHDAKGIKMVLHDFIPEYSPSENSAVL